MAEKDIRKIEQASKILGISFDELELALGMLDEVKTKMNEWEKTNGLRKKD
jgi:hypothetical protein